MFYLKNLEKASPLCFSSPCLEREHPARRCGSCLVTTSDKQARACGTEARVEALMVLDIRTAACLWSFYMKSETKHPRSLLDRAIVARTFVVLQLMLCDQGSCLSWASCLEPNTMTGAVLPLWKDKEIILKDNNNKNNKWLICLFPCILSKIVSFFLYILGKHFPFLNRLVAYREVLFAMQNKSIFKTLQCLDS